ncbi:hypothetical protein L5515_008039 [Caenorhabditis briggsae]|uniref:Uncharacterized protein n=1 Tax=Caenorhabditis briggsae TaxID=6238 RepID=A0AAE9F0B1_CAEBR|nr:hypothetical protein L5515_008039 [Caenorhabditis briggsae]
MVNYQLLRNDFSANTEKFKEFYRYRKSVFYYCGIILIVVFLAVNFLSYDDETIDSQEQNYAEHPRNIVAEQESGQKLPFTTTPSPPLIPYKYEELPACDLSTDSPKPLHNAEAIANEFFKCASMILLRFAMNPQGMLFNWPYTIYVCDEEDLSSRIPLISFDNGQKQYWAVLPTCQEKTTLVTLGASENTKSEEDIKKLLKDLETFGTDPFHGKNNAYGKFNQVALSTDDHEISMVDSNDKFSDKNFVATVDQREFFNVTVGTYKIDMLWITPNAGNFEYEKYLNKDGEFEKMGVKVCQINIEITKNDADKWFKLINPLVQEKRFIFMRPMATEGGELIRTYLLNVADPECYDSNRKIVPADKIIVAVEDNDETTKKPLPPFNYDSLPPCDLNEELEKPKLNLKTIQKSFLKCVFPLLTRFFGNPEGLLFNFSSVLSVCDDEEEIRNIDVTEIANDRWVIFPKCNENNTMVTLGVEKETNAESWLEEKIPNLKMYGTSGLINASHVYEHFENVAIGKEADSVKMEVMENGVLVNKTMDQKKIEEYIKDLNLTKIDILWINPYYGKFSFWDYLKRDGLLSKQGITICQMIIEVPKGHGNQWAEMIKPMQNNSSFVFMKPTTTKSGGAKAFFINYQDPECTRKYLES